MAKITALDTAISSVSAFCQSLLIGANAKKANSWYTNFMSESQQILFMQIRLLRMMAEKYALSLKQAAEIFKKYNVLPFIREGYGIFHVEGDEAIFEEVKSYLYSKGAAL